MLARRARAWVGVDAGKFSHSLVVRYELEDSKPCTVPTSREGFETAVRFIQQAAPVAAPGEVLVGIEFVGSYGFTFAHFLSQRGFQVVSVLPLHTKRWKDVVHRQSLKTDAADALGIVDLTAQGHFVGFPFLKPEYARLRTLVAGRERLSVLRRRAITQSRSLLQLLFPEYEALFRSFTKKTPFGLLRAFPGPQALLDAPKRRVLKVLGELSRGQHGVEMYDRLLAAARGTLALPGLADELARELQLTLARLELYDQQITTVEAAMVEVLREVPEAAFLQTIPGVGPLTAAIFLGSVGDPRAYASSKEILKVAGLSLVERSSGILKGRQRISKRGRPLLRQAAYMLAVRSVRVDGIYRAKFERLVAQNGGRKIPALVAVSRSALKAMHQVARERRPWVPDRVPDGVPAGAAARVR